MEIQHVKYMADYIDNSLNEKILLKVAAVQGIIDGFVRHMGVDRVL